MPAIEYMISRGKRYLLIPLWEQRRDGQVIKILEWAVDDMPKCNRCDARGPVLVCLRDGDYYTLCCGLHLGGKA